MCIRDRSKIAEASVASDKTSPHFENCWLEVTIVEYFSYRLARSWNNKLAPVLSTGRYPTSSIINSLYLLYCLILSTNLFSLWARESWEIKSWQEMKYVLTLFLAASIPIAVAICVFPVPGEPIKRIFFFSSINLREANSRTCSLLIEGWKEKSKSSKVL